MCTTTCAKTPRSPSIADTTLHKRRCCRSIDGVIQVIRVNDRKIIADEIIVKAISHDFTRIHIREGASFERISENHLCLHINIKPKDLSGILTYDSGNSRSDLGAHLGFP